MAENKVVVHIFGEEYPIAGATDPAHISRVAEYVDMKMQQAARANDIQARDRVAILAAMSMASELLEKSGRLGALEQEFLPSLDKVLADLESALRDDTHTVQGALL
ncbi:MAG TPA: cell division protein ZapA [Candidatus Deferrimicrobium sp.]|nr:cell division protein ZapA [Candidatus Deferrimicrobium sp.]